MIKAQKGTKDIINNDVTAFQTIENVAAEVFSNSGYKEIRTPIFEATELFARGVGNSTDIVNKEMYTFEKSERSLTLRPENTAGVVRAYIENGMHRLSAPVKLWYKGPMFRYERPQAGRMRQFHQVGLELFGIEAPSADAEAIITAVEFLNKLGIQNLTVELNSLGCDSCRQNYRQNIKEITKKYLENLCDDCKMRFEKNPLRMLDCKDENCQKIFKNEEIQKVIFGDFICNDCSEHFETLKSYLDSAGIKYKINKLLVRGLDYYNRTVFEIKSENLGAQNAVCGGGRYDKLVETLGGNPTNAFGWAMGMERLAALMESADPKKLKYYIVSTDTKEALKLAKKLRENNLSCDFDLNGKKFVKQLEKAAKTAEFALILGEDEIKAGTVSVKNLADGTQKTVKIEELHIKSIAD